MLDDSLEIIWNNHEFRYSYNIQSSFSNSKKGIPFRNHADSLILCYAKGFAPYCSPSGFSWFLLTKHRKKITTIDSKEKLLALLGNIDSYPKAYLMLCAAGYTTPYTYTIYTKKRCIRCINTLYTYTKYTKICYQKKIHQTNLLFFYHPMIPLKHKSV